MRNQYIIKRYIITQVTKRNINAFGGKKNYSKARGFEIAKGHVALFRGVGEDSLSRKVVSELTGNCEGVQKCSYLGEGSLCDRLSGHQVLEERESLHVC